MARDFRIMGDEDDGDTLAVEVLEQGQDLQRGAAVEGTGRLVGEQEAGLVDERAGDGDALLLAAGKLHGAVMGSFGQAHAAQRGERPLAPNLAVGPGIDHRQLDIGARIDARQQVELLEDEAQLAVAQLGEAVASERLDGDAVKAVMPPRRPVETADSGS